LGLVLVWCAGRVVMAFAGWLPDGIVAAVDLAFLPVLAIYVARVLTHHHNYRNLVLVAVLGLLYTGNVIMHLGFIKGHSALLVEGQQLGFNLVTLLIIIIAGRIIPAFSANWLRLQGGDTAGVRIRPGVEKLAFGSMILLIIADGLSLPGRLIGGVALITGFINGVRLVGWAGWRTHSEPLLWILHIAYLWVVLALLLRGLSHFTDLVGATTWQHALGLGGFATLILGVMTRVAVGHTGRPLQLLNRGIWIYLAIIGAAILRVMATTGITDYRITVSLSALLWVLAFSLFIGLYAPVLASPRIDGRPG